MNKTILVGVVALGLSAGALANGHGAEAAMPIAVSNSDFNPGIYMGLQAGYALSGWNHFEGSAASSTPKVSRTDSFAGRVFAGYDFTKNFAAEAGYLALGTKAKLKNASGAQVAKIRTQAIDLTGKIKVALDDSFGVYAKAGLGYLMSHGLRTTDASGATVMFEKNNFGNLNAVYGLGMSYNVNSNVVADLSWTQYVGSATMKQNTSSQYTGYQPSVNFFGLGVAYKFNM